MKKLKTILAASIVIAGLTIVVSFVQQHEPKEHWEAPKSADKIRNPLAGNIQATREGKILFENQCAVCHGPRGKGNGSIAVSLKPKPADLTSKMTQSHTDGALYWKIMQGSTPMPSFKDAHKINHNQCWQLINYIRELEKQAKK